MPADITSERLLDALTWEWQKVEDLMELLIPTVPPGKALRKYKMRGANTGVKPLTDDEQIASGARQLVNDRIGSQVESGRVELEGDRGARRVRFRERREVADQRGCCRTCNRPFPQATPTTPPVSSPPASTVVYPRFPGWERLSG